MYYISTRMQAYAMHLSSIEIQVSKQYYNGIVKTFYIRETNQKRVMKLSVNNEWEDEQNHYYQLNFTIDIAKVYDILNGYGLTVVLQYSKLIHMPEFDKYFYYSNTDLGSIYNKEQTTWKVWAPTALEMSLCFKNMGISYRMQKDSKGIFNITLTGDYDGEVYTYIVHHGDTQIETLDPYSYSSLANGKGSVVINLERCPILVTNLPTIKKKSDIIIYEMSVRDFTIDETLHCKYPGKYLGLIEKGLRTKKGNPAGIDYLTSLGITHVQFMPIYDFASVDEYQSDILYNWGYDPLQYNVPEGSYCLNPEDPYSRIIECQKMIHGLHQEGLYVVMDVVYNHMYDTMQCAYENLVPGYYLRRYPDGHLSNGSWCGNDINTSALMVRKYLVDMSLRWVEMYGIDGLRFDLMGLIDIETMKEIHSACITQNPNLVIYGEGWDMETALPYAERTLQDHHIQIPMIGFFNDMYRDKLKGLSSDNNLHDKGYFSGNMYNTELVCQCLKNNERYSAVIQSINYVECHDNATIYDKYSISNENEEEVLRRRRQKLLTMTTILAQGIPFLHSGQEFYRTKKGITNSYCSHDEINKIDWDCTDTFYEDIQDIQKIISIRKKYAECWYDTNQEVEKHILTESKYHELIKYTLHQTTGQYHTLLIYINGSNHSHTIEVPENYDILYKDKKVKEIVEIPMVSMVILGVR